MSNRKPRKPAAKAGTVSQRQLRASEMIRHALVEVMRENEIRDPALVGVSVTVTEVRLSPDLKHATCFVEPLGAGVETAPVAGHIDEIVKALNIHAKFLRGALGRHIDMRFTPDLRFRHDESFAAAERLNRLLDDPRVRADVYVSPFEDDDAEEDGPQAARGAVGSTEES
ncbi:30S ribosome-binding factor RbfA [Brevundimonas sp.]|uniref:30S ribosome-binding factor RbfA n=1 Tax=Brevundimonas sp. TaxID=1871086 RepID=UPI002CAFFD08|nr:30S ribosome-binding factor RbfA [Brevundimonas sp.]HWQ87627.1 30S ribosome-binding factor RbfA [Brevundimonas sp.]